MVYGNKKRVCGCDLGVIMCVNELIKVTNLSKCYELYKNTNDRLKQKIFRNRKYYEDFWALKEVSFEVGKGETFGIIGVNGSGKSTLLQILAGILTPTKGTMQINGKVSALLELGSGFNPEYTGRENVYINASVLGLKKDVIDKRLDEIIQFADIGEFIDQPVKLYSSGMFVRLAFAVATSVDADILLIDEALAVGDVFFRQKCYDRLNRLRDNGTSIILVSHAMNEVEQFCDRTLLLSDGKTKYYGRSINAVKKYYMIAEEKTRRVACERLADTENLGVKKVQRSDWIEATDVLQLNEDDIESTGEVTLLRAVLTDEQLKPARTFYQGQTAIFHTEYLVNKDIEVPGVGVCFYNDRNIIVHGKTTYQMNTIVPKAVKKGTVLRFSQEVYLDIEDGEYTFELGFSTVNNETYQRRNVMEHEMFNNEVRPISTLSNAGPFMVMRKLNDGYTHLNHYGLVDLRGKCECAVVEEK